MSKIRRISIKGIRNFSDNDENEIVFKCPITLILGENGTGKTTIIECLKYATTGECPPNSDKGKSFVTDPALGSTSSTRAAVRLEYENKKGKIMTAFRSLELRRTANSMTISSIDNTLSYYNDKAKKFVNMSNRCADTNSMLIEMMGVSKALLNYVIFCHQDDSFWPLEGGKELKTKMDEIFGTVKYNKALESMRSLSRDNTLRLKLLKQSKDSLKQHVDANEMKKKKLNDDKERRDKMNKEISDLEAQMEPINNQMQEISQNIGLYNDKLTESKNKRMEYENANKVMSYLQNNIDELFKGTDRELQEKIDSIDKDYNDKSRKTSQLEKKLEDGYAKEKEIAKLLNEQKVTTGTLEQKMKDQSIRIEKRNEILVTALKNWNIEQQSSIANETEAKSLMEQLSKKRVNFESEAESTRIKRERAEKTMQNNIDSLISSSSALRSEMNLKEEECLHIQTDLQKIRKDISDAGTASNRLKDSELRLEEATEEYDAVLNSLDVDKLKKEVEDYTVEERENEKLARELDKEITVLNDMSSLQSEINVHQSNLKIKTDQIESIREKHEQSLKSILEVDEIPMKKLRHNIEGAQQNLNDIKRKIKRDIESVQQQITSLKTTCAHQEKDLEKKIAEIEADKKKLADFCTYDNYEDALKLQLTKLKSLRDRKGFFSFQRIAYEKYLDEIKEDKPCCPLCTRDFKSSNEVSQFKVSMRKQMDQNPNAVKSCETELKAEETKYDTMLQLKPIVSKIRQFENYEFKQMKNNIEETKEQMQAAKDKLEILNNSLQNPEEKLKMCEAVISDIALWDQCIDEIEKINRKIKAKQNSLQYKTESTRTLEEVNAERESCHERISECRKNKEQLQSQLEKYNNKKQVAWENKKSLQEKVLNIRSEMQKVNQLREKEKELTIKISCLNDSILSLREKFTNEDANLNAATEKLKSYKAASLALQQENKTIVNREQHIWFKLSSYQKEIDEFIRQNIEKKIKESEEAIERLNKSLNDIKIENARLAKELQQLKSDFSTHEKIKRDLMNNVELRKKQIEVHRLKEQYLELEKTVMSMNYNELLSEMNNLKKDKAGYMEKQYAAKGVVAELDRQIESLEGELMSEQNIKNLKDYKSTCAELNIVQNIQDDLNIYMQGMDQAMTDYHQDRMNAVNEIMSRMWCAVYKGTDIKGIQIKTESTGKMDSLRRVFNYKLVQIKHGIEMEMKGRCSAGQKVLASIIIRIALAEAFCGDCGVLALDEPTTNLDVHNARSLASALLKIVEARSKHQKNFQLILITHDEEFLRVLAKLDPDNSYYKLLRDERTGRTVITQQVAGHEVDDLGGQGTDTIPKKGHK